MGDIIKTERLKLSGTSNSPKEAENVFKDIEEKTGTKIQFESGHFANTYKRDPVIRLCGPPDAVKSAKEMVLQNLEIQSNRIILKMDVTHEEHPSLIGKKGFLIKKVMDSTNCHIHFPDTNLIAENTKSNQVSITGEPLNVERARIMLRALLPFQIIFDVNISSGQMINTALPIWKEMEEQLGLVVHFMRQKNVMTIIIRCYLGLFPSLRHQILTLIEILSGKRGNNLPPVTVFMDIMPQHHNIVKGPKGSNIQAISKRTGAKIEFPNRNTLTFENRRINITGSLDSVYMACLEVMSSLPITVSFDVSVNREINNDFMDFLQDCNIIIYSRPKPRFYIQSITVKGPERFSKQIIQYRQRILNLSPVKFQPDVDDINVALTFHSFTAEMQNSQVFLSLCDTQLQNTANILNVNNYFQNVESIAAPHVSNDISLYPSIPYADVLTYYNKKWLEKFPNVTPSLCDTGNYVHPTLGFNSWEQITAIANNNNDAVIKEPKELAEHVRETYRSSDDLLSHNSPLKIQGVNEYEIFEKKLSAHQAIHRRIESTQVPSSLWAGYGFSQSMPVTSVNKNTESLNRFSYRSLESNNSSSSDESWDIVLADYIDDKIWSVHGENVFSMSNVFDFKRNTSSAMKFDSDDILPRLLYEEGLYNYIDVFLREEIDYAAFLLLNESDLAKLGINYQARMKITCLIRELQDAEMKTFDAAPGAERKLRIK